LLETKCCRNSNILQLCIHFNFFTIRNTTKTTHL
jgi:hypothetical protein